MKQKAKSMNSILLIVLFAAVSMTVLAIATHADSITANSWKITSVDKNFAETSLYNCFHTKCEVYLNITNLENIMRKFNFTASFIKEWDVTSIEVWEKNTTLNSWVWEGVNFKKNGFNYKNRAHNIAENYNFGKNETKTFRINYNAFMRVLGSLVKFDIVGKEGITETILDPLVNSSRWEFGTTADVNTSSLQTFNYQLDGYDNLTLNGTQADAPNDANTLLLCRLNDSTTCEGGEVPDVSNNVAFGGGVIGSSFIQNMNVNRNLVYNATNNVILENMTVTFWFNRTADTDANLGRMLEITDGTNTNLVQIRLGVHASGGIIPFYNIGNKTGGLMNENSICSGVTGDNFNKTGWNFVSFRINRSIWRCGYSTLDFSNVQVTSARDEGNTGSMRIRIAGSIVGRLNGTFDDIRISSIFESDDAIEHIYRSRETYNTSNSSIRTNLITLSKNMTHYKLNVTAGAVLPSGTSLQINISCDDGQTWNVTPIQNQFVECHPNSVSKDKFLVNMYIGSNGILTTPLLNISNAVNLEFTDDVYYRITRCPFTVINASTLDTNLTSNDTCLSFGAINTELNCQGKSITGNQSGAGINSTGFNNSLIKNCIATNFTDGILLKDSNDYVVNDNTVYDNIGSNIKVTGNSINNAFNNNNATTWLDNAFNQTVLSNGRPVPVLRVENSSLGGINWTSLTLTTSHRIINLINISQNFLRVNVVAAPQMNKTAFMTIKNVSFTNPEPQVDAEDTNSFVSCATSVCTEISYASNTFIFNATHFSTYKAGETPVNASDETNCIIKIEEGINATIPSATRHKYQRAYMTTGSSQHFYGRFDYIASLGVQRWAFNCITPGEIFTNMPKLGRAVTTWENTSISPNEVRKQVEEVINSTKV